MKHWLVEDYYIRPVPGVFQSSPHLLRVRDSLVSTRVGRGFDWGVATSRSRGGAGRRLRLPGRTYSYGGLKVHHPSYRGDSSASALRFSSENAWSAGPGPWSLVCANVPPVANGQRTRPGVRDRPVPPAVHERRRRVEDELRGDGPECPDS